MIGISEIHGDINQRHLRGNDISASRIEDSNSAASALERSFDFLMTLLILIHD